MAHSNRATNRYMEEIMITTIALLLALSLTGCAQMFTAKTTVHYEERRPDGTVIIADYSSDKDQQELKAHLGANPSIETGKASQPEGLAAATLAAQIKWLDFIEKLTAGARAGATSGS
jgi:hypothetical protein